MTTQPDFEELLRSLEESGVDYMVVGVSAKLWYVSVFPKTN